MLNLQHYRSKLKGLPDLLNIAFLVAEPLVEAGGRKPMGFWPPVRGTVRGRR